MAKFFFLKKYMIPWHLLPDREGISTYFTVLLVSTDNKVEASCFEVINDNWSEDGLNWKQNRLDVVGLLPPPISFPYNSTTRHHGAHEWEQRFWSFIEISNRQKFQTKLWMGKRLWYIHDSANDNSETLRISGHVAIDNSNLSVKTSHSSSTECVL